MLIGPPQTRLAAATTGLASKGAPESMSGVSEIIHCMRVPLLSEVVLDL